MKKYIINACMAVTLMAGATSCSNEELVEKQLNPTGDLMLSANIGTSSRTSVDETGKATWVKGDKLYAWGNGSNAEFTLYEGAGKVEGLFTGELKKGYAEYLEKVAYPLEMVTEESGKVYVNLSEVNYGNSSAPMYGTISDGNVAFSNLTSMLRIRVKNMPDNATLTVSGTGIGGKAELKDGSLESVTGTKKVTVKGIPGGDKGIDVPVYAVGQTDLSISVNGCTPYIVSLNIEKDKVYMNPIPQLSYVNNTLALVWNKAVDTNWYDSSNDEFTLTNPAQLAGLAKLVNDGTPGGIKNKTIKLGASFDMNKHSFNAIGLYDSSLQFANDFDGQGHTISGLNVEGGTAGLFGNVGNATIKNLTITNSYFNGSQYSGCVVARVRGNVELENVVVTNSKAIEAGVDYGNRMFGKNDGKTPTVDGGNYNYVETQEELASAISGGAKYIQIGEGNYTFPANSLQSGMTLECEEGTTFTGTSGLNIKGATVVGATFSNPGNTASTGTINGTFKDCKFEGQKGLYYGYATDVVVFEDCEFTSDDYTFHFDGSASGYTGKAEIICRRCVFNAGWRVAIGGGVSSTLMEDCVFNVKGFINTYNDVTYTRCSFSDSMYGLRCLGGTGTYNDCTYNKKQLTIDDITLFEDYPCTVVINGRTYENQ